MVVNNVVCELSVAVVLPFMSDKRSTACLDSDYNTSSKAPQYRLNLSNKNLKNLIKIFPSFLSQFCDIMLNFLLEKYLGVTAK